MQGRELTQTDACLCLLSARVKGVCHHAQPLYTESWGQLEGRFEKKKTHRQASRPRQSVHLVSESLSCAQS